MQGKSEDKIKILYLDDTCKVTDVCILIRKYYFPLATSRSITFDEIEKISLQNGMNEIHRWGPSIHNINNWFPLDGGRKNKSRFLAIHLKGKKVVPSFTPLDATKLFSILKDYIEEHGNYEIKFEDNLEYDNLKHLHKIDENRTICFGEEASKEPLSQANVNMNVSH